MEASSDRIVGGQIGEGARMTGARDELVAWLTAARAGSREDLGRALEACRRYLLLIAGRELAPDLRAKGGASDLVQQTFLEAHQGFGRFEGGSPEEFRGWLRRILRNNVANFTRHYRDAACRRVTAERPLAAGDSAADDDLAASTLTPSGNAIAREQAEAVQRALARLPEDYRLVLALRHQEQLTFEEIGEVLERTPNAARLLWLRAVERLQEEVGVSGESG
jgi:RNA polymerase sigma-70 factor (ECF subfamily)